MEVAKAIAECAFDTCEMPVVLSMEMHCSPPLQRKLAVVMLEHLGTTLFMVRLIALIPCGRASRTMCGDGSHFCLRSLSLYQRSN